MYRYHSLRVFHQQRLYFHVAIETLCLVDGLVRLGASFEEPRLIGDAGQWQQQFELRFVGASQDGELVLLLHKLLGHHDFTCLRGTLFFFQN